MKWADSVQHRVFGTKGAFFFQAHPEPDHSQGHCAAGRRVTEEHGHHGDLVRTHPPRATATALILLSTTGYVPGIVQGNFHLFLIFPTIL